MKPPNGKGALLHAPLQRPQNHIIRAARWRNPCFVGWQREADRLLGEYLRTRCVRHWHAYRRHIEGMASRLGGATQ